jgi:hypothetical protein
LTVRLGKGLREESWVGWVVVLLALLALGMAIPIDVLGLDDSNSRGHSADTPLVAEIVQVKAIGLSDEGLLPALSSPSVTSKILPAVFEARRALPKSAARPLPLLGPWILPRANVARDDSRAEASTTDPVQPQDCPGMVERRGSRPPRSIVDQMPDGRSAFSLSDLMC